MGSKRPPIDQFHDKKGRTELIGVRLMQEPGFAAPALDIHQYGRHGPIRKGLFAGVPQIQSHRVTRLPVVEIVKSTPVLNAEPTNSPPQERRAQSSVSYYTRSNHHPRSRLLHGEESSPKHRSSPSQKDPSSRRRRGNSAESPYFERPDRLGTDFSSAIRSVPPVPQVFLKLLGTREVPALGKVRVSVRVSPAVLSPGPDEAAILSLDKKNHLVIVVEPKTSSSHIHRLGVSAPKIFSFDQVHSREDDQNNVMSRVVPDILQAVIGGNDGCILCFGGSGMGKSHTMVGSYSPPSQMGVMPYSISWLYQSINHLKNSNAAKFSIRASAVLVDASGKSLIDVLGPYAKESEISPGALLRQSCGGFLSSVAELRAPTPEVAARFLDLALNTRSALSTDKRSGFTVSSTLLFSLHVYQQSLDSKDRGKVIGGRSRLHLMDLGDTSGNNKGSLSLSGITSVLLAIFNGKKYLPHKSNKLTQLLQEALGSVTCHASMIVHVSPSQRHLQHTLATLQLASRVHRLRRKKIKGFLSLGSSNSSDSSKRRSSGEETSAESSSIDFSSSELSADTVIYLGGGSGPGDSTDGEHPPIFLSHHLRRNRSVELPRLRSMEHLRPHTASPLPAQPKRPTSASPTPTSRSVPSNRVKIKPKPPPRQTSYNSRDNIINSPNQPVFFRHNPGVSRIDYPSTSNSRALLLSSLNPSENEPILLSPPVADKKMNYKFYQEPNTLVPVFQSNNVIPSNFSSSNSRQVIYRQNPNALPISVQPSSNQLHSFSLPEKGSGHLQNKSSEICMSDEHWIDGPRISKRRAQSVKNTSKQPETWVDGPSIPKVGNYGFMDDHKKTMIERWVENQTAQVINPDEKESSSTVFNNLNEGIPKLLNSSSTSTLNGSINPAEDMTLESDVDTISEDHSGALTAPEDKQLSFMEELEKKSLIPVELDPSLRNLSEVFRLEVDTQKSERSSPEMSHGDEPSMDEICSQCEALAEECEEFNSLLACEEEECKRQEHQGLATVMEEPELESVYGGDYPVDSMSLLNNPQTDCEDAADALESSEQENSRWNQRDSIGDIKGRPQMSIRKTADCAIQVYQEDIARALSNTPCPSEVSSSSMGANDDHPLRVLSEENLSCASTFTDTNSLMEDSGEGECLSDIESRPFSLLEVSDYGKLYEELHRSKFLQKDTNCRELATIHEQFSALTQNKNIVTYARTQSPPALVNRNTQLSSYPNPFIVSKGTFFQDQITKLGKDSCDSCSKKMRADHEHNYNSQNSTSITSQPCNQELNRNCISRDKCTSTEEVVKSDSNFDCRMRRELVLNASSLYYNLDSYEGKVPSMELANDLTNFNIVTNSSINKSIFTKVKSTKYVKNVEDNGILCDPVVTFTCSCRTGFNSCDIHEVNPPTDTCSDNDSDCHSCVSEDSEYIIKNSKLSRFLCVGIGKTKSKTSVKGNKTAIKQSDNKKHLFKFRENKPKNNNNKFVDTSNPSECQNSKNLILSPPRTLLQNPTKTARPENLATIWQIDQRKVGGAIEGAGIKGDCICDGFSDSVPSTQACNTPIDFCDIQDMSTPLDNRKCWNESSSTVPSCRSPQNIQDAPSNSSTTTKATTSHPMTTSGSLGTTQSLGESSGYESILRDSECSSFSSSQESEMDEEHRREARSIRGIPLRKSAATSSSPVRSNAFLINKTGDRMEDRLRHGDLGKRYNFRVIKKSSKK